METIKVKTGDMMSAFYALQDLAKMKMPVKGAYAVSRLLMKLTPDFEAAEKHRIEIIQSVAPESKEGENIQLFPGTPEFKEFMIKFSEVTDTEIEVSAFLIDLDHLGDIDITPETLVKLHPFLTT